MMYKIAIDCMGGDNAPDNILDAIMSFPSIKFLLCGDSSILKNKLCTVPGHCEIVHADGIVNDDLKPSAALRGAFDTSMHIAIKCVQEQRAQACISSGNTGAYMVLAKHMLGMCSDVERPAIARFIPSRQGTPCLFLDLGANVANTPEQLKQFAVLGSSIYPAANPTVGLLNVGVEANKGNALVKDAYQLLANTTEINFVGFVEGFDLFSGKVNVLVTDGFTGNIALKVMESTAEFMCNVLKQSLSAGGVFTKLGTYIASGALRDFKDKIDPKNYNGALLLGVQGIVIKSHGGSDAKAFASAIQCAVECISKNIKT